MSSISICLIFPQSKASQRLASSLMNTLHSYMNRKTRIKLSLAAATTTSHPGIIYFHIETKIDSCRDYLPKGVP